MFLKTSFAGGSFPNNPAPLLPINEAPPPDDSLGDHVNDQIDNLVLNADATKTSTGTGNWGTAGTWSPSGVPTIGDKVVVRDVDTVTYNVDSTDDIEWVRVDGEMIFSTTVDTKLVLDTLVVSIGGKLTMGTVGTPMPSARLCEIVIADNGTFDLAYDPFKFSRGIIIEGDIEVYAAPKLSYLKVATDPMISDTSVVLNDTATGWEVGDRIVVGATFYEGFHYDGSSNSWHQNEDEIRTITSFSTTTETNDTVHFSGGLVNDHSGPATRQDLKTYVANYTRNIRFVNENSATVNLHERPHFMCVGHMASADVRYLEIDEFGRTDKSINSIEAMDVVTMTATTNVRGRYAAHCHHVGVDSASRRAPPIFVGCSIYGSPGWGLVQHVSCGNWYRNVSYGIFGAAFVSEAGNENGTWKENLAIFCRGIGWKTPKLQDNFVDNDTGQSGDGFHMVGRMVRCKGNIAISCNDGVSFLHRSGGPVSADQFQIPDVLRRLEADLPGHVPIIHLTDNETFACSTGLYIEKANPDQKHDMATIIDGHKSWNVVIGLMQNYTSKYIVKNLDLFAGNSNTIPSGEPTYGLVIGNNTFEMHYIDPIIEGFGDAILTQHIIVETYHLEPSALNYTAVRPTYIDNDNDWTLFDAAKGDLLFPTTGDLPGNTFGVSASAFTDVGGGGSFIVDLLKTDGLGSTEMYHEGAEFQTTDWNADDTLRYIDNNGYFTDSGNSNTYVIIPMWFTDRLTGEHHCTGMKITINAGRNLTSYTNNGDINDPNTAPAVSDITGQTASTAVTKTFDLVTLSGATDSDGDTPTLLASERTINADVHDNGDGTVDYLCDFGFTGVDTFKFWIQDGHGGITGATFSVTVS